jgi:ABC-type transport system substrate-binding protein
LRSEEITELETYIRKLLVLALVLTLLSTALMVIAPVKATTVYGPRMDQLSIKFYDSPESEFAALESQEIDLVDTSLDRATVDKWKAAPYTNYIAEDAVREIGLYQIDINNNYSMSSYPSIPNPCYYVEFRHALAHLADKNYYVQNITGNYAVKLDSPVMPWLRWYDPTMAVHAYSKAEACQILYNAGWRDSLDPEVTADVHYPSSIPNVGGQNLNEVLINGPDGASDPGLVFYGLRDLTERSQAGIAFMQAAESIGIPIDNPGLRRGGDMRDRVFYNKNFHLYLGGWILDKDPDYLYDLYNSAYINWNTNQYAQNYDNVNDSTFDVATRNVKYATNLNDAWTYCHQALQIWGNKVFTIPLWTTKGYMAHNKAWHALNVDSYGTRDWWNLYCTYQQAGPSVGGTLRWGFAEEMTRLNIVGSYYEGSYAENRILELIYQPLILFNPLNIGIDAAGIAKSWTIGYWTNPDTGLPATKIVFTIRNDVRWVQPATGTALGCITPEDVRFTFQYIRDNPFWMWDYPPIAGLYHSPGNNTLKIETGINTATFYESTLSAWASHWIGNVPIIPKSVFEGMTWNDLYSGMFPGGSPDSLVGCGAFYFAEYVPGSHITLNANRNYFKTIFPNTDTSPTMIKLDWGLFKGDLNGDWTVNVLDLIILIGYFPWIGLPGEIPQDINKDGKVNTLDLIIVATNIGASWP